MGQKAFPCRLATMFLKLMLFYSSGLLLFIPAIDGSRVELSNNGGYRDIVSLQFHLTLLKTTIFWQTFRYYRALLFCVQKK